MKYTKYKHKQDITIADGFILLATGCMGLMTLCLVLPKIM